VLVGAERGEAGREDAWRHRVGCETS
jgi:hypothetical protein